MISTYEVWFLPLCHPVQWGQNVERTVLRVTTAVTNYIAQSITDWKKKVDSTVCRADTVQYVLQFCGWQLLQYPPYPAELSPCEYDLISQRKQPLRGLWWAKTTFIHTWGRGNAVWRVSWHEWRKAPTPSVAKNSRQILGTKLKILLAVLVAPLSPYSLRTLD